MCFHLKIYLILFNSFCMFWLEHIDVFLMFLLLLAIKNKTIIQNKTEDRQSVTSSNWARRTNPRQLFKPNKPTRQLSFWEIQKFEVVWHYWLYTSKYINLIFYKDAYLVYAYTVIMTNAKSFSPSTVLPLLYKSVKRSC